MDDIPEARDISGPTLEEMIRVAEPTWELREAVPAERGFCSVYRVEVDRNGRTEEVYVKAHPTVGPGAFRRKPGSSRSSANTRRFPSRTSSA